MQIYNLIFHEKDISKKKLSFIIKKGKFSYLHATIYENNSCLLSNGAIILDIPKLTEYNLYEFIFNNEFVNSILNANIDYFSFNNDNNKKTFKKFQNQLKKLSTK